MPAAGIGSEGIFGTPGTCREGTPGTLAGRGRDAIFGMPGSCGTAGTPGSAGVAGLGSTGAFTPDGWGTATVSGLFKTTPPPADRVATGKPDKADKQRADFGPMKLKRTKGSGGTD